MPVQAIPLFPDLSVFAEFHIPDLAPLDVTHLVVIHLLLLIGRQISIAVKTDSFMALLNRVITERRQIRRMRSSCVSKTWTAAWQRRKKRGILGRNKHKPQKYEVSCCTDCLCPTEFYSTKPLKPLIIGASAFRLHAPGVRNKSPAGVYFFQGVNRSLLRQGFFRVYFRCRR